MRAAKESAEPTQEQRKTRRRNKAFKIFFLNGTNQTFSITSYFPLCLLMFGENLLLLKKIFLKERPFDINPTPTLQEREVYPWFPIISQAAAEAF